MDDLTAGMTSVIGERIRAERRAREWTLDQLAEVAGVSRRMVVNVEQGTANASIGTLLKLSDALGIGLPSLVAPPEVAPVTVIRSGDGAQLWTGADGGRGVLVAGTRPPDVVELWDWSMAPGEQHASGAHSAGTAELLHVLAGAITLQVGAERHELAAGDAASFPGDLPHSYANHGTELARFSLAVFEPGVGSTNPAGGPA